MYLFSMFLFLNAFPIRGFVAIRRNCTYGTYRREYIAHCTLHIAHCGSYVYFRIQLREDHILCSGNEVLPMHLGLFLYKSVSDLNVTMAQPRDMNFMGRTTGLDSIVFCFASEGQRLSF